MASVTTVVSDFNRQLSVSVHALSQYGMEGYLAQTLIALNIPTVSAAWKHLFQNPKGAFDDLKGISEVEGGAIGDAVLAFAAAKCPTSKQVLTALPLLSLSNGRPAISLLKTLDANGNGNPASVVINSSDMAPTLPGNLNDLRPTTLVTLGEIPMDNLQALCWLASEHPNELQRFLTVVDSDGAAVAKVLKNDNLAELFKDIARAVVVVALNKREWNPKWYKFIQRLVTFGINELYLEDSGDLEEEED